MHSSELIQIYVWASCTIKLKYINLTAVRGWGGDEWGGKGGGGYSRNSTWTSIYTFKFAIRADFRFLIYKCGTGLSLF